MPVHEDSSIIPDSTTSSSPIMTPVPKRAGRTYGRPRPAAESPEETDLSFSSSGGDLGSQSSVYKTAMPFSQDEVPPSSDAELSFSTVDQDEEEGASGKDASQRFNFGWREKLKALDEQDDFDNVFEGVRDNMDASSSGSPSEQPPLSEHSDSSPGSDITKKAEPVQNASSKPLFLSDVSDSEQSPLRRTTKRRTLARMDSDGEEEAPKSTPQSEDPSFAFTPPTKARQSPTPPTSDEDEDVPSRILPKNHSRNKGKGKATERTDAMPLEPVDNAADLAFNDSDKKSRTKRPTKKDIMETIKTRSRLNAEQNVAIPRNQASSQYTLSNLLSEVAGTLPSSQPSDTETIKDFSSDAPNSPGLEAIQSAADLDQGSSSKQPLRPVRPIVSSPSPTSRKLQRSFAKDSDDEMPDISTLSKQSVKPDPAKVLAMKKRFAEQLNASRMEMEDDSDDDLQIVDTVDMQTALKMEASERKAGRRKPLPEGRKRQLQLAAQSRKSQGGAQDPKKRGPAAGGFKDRDHLNVALFNKVQQINRQAIEDKETRWAQLGGTLKKDPEAGRSTAEDGMKQYAKQALANISAKNKGTEEPGEEDEEDEDDPDWEEAEVDRGSVTPSPSKPRPSAEQAEEEEEELRATTPSLTNDEDQDMSPSRPRNRRPKNQAIVDSDDDDENQPPQIRSPSPTFSSIRLGASPLPPPAVLGHRGSLSSLDERTEDDGDKENDNSRVWANEDKENKAASPQVAVLFGERKPGLNRLGSLSSSRTWTPVVSPSGGIEDRRKPFQDLLDDDPFTSPSRASQPSSFLAKLHQSSPAPQGRPSPEDENAKFASSSKLTLEPSFSDLFESGTAKQPARSLFKSPGGPLSGLGDAFSDEEDTTPFRPLGMDDELSLTQDVGLEPAFQIGTQAQRQADQIFEKEQEYLIAAETVQKVQKEPTLYVNEIGFLTQTKPSTSSPEVYRQPPTPSQSMPFTQPQTSPRKPLRTLSYTASSPMHSESPAGLTRLRKRSTSPTSPSKQRIGLSRSVTAFDRPPKNAFDALKEGAQRKEKMDHTRKMLDKSEFVENEAQESDDDELVGFGLMKKKDDEEEGGEDLDQNLESLVDDHKMDETEENADVVRQKFQEQLDKDDEALEEYHQKAVQGEFRKKRRGQGLGLDDSDDSENEDNEARLRRKMHKRPRIDRDDINELGKHSETAAFFNIYNQDLQVEGDFDYMKESQPPDVIMADDGDNEQELYSEEEEEDDENVPQSISVHEARKQAVERAQFVRESGFDAANLDWMEEVEEEDGLVIKPVAAPRPHERHAEDAEGSGLPTPRSTLVSERSVMWAKQEGRSRTAGTTGRSVGGAAVTGHKAKSGGGSVRGSRSSASAQSASKAEQQRKPLKAQKSVLGTVAAERNAKFK